LLCGLSNEKKNAKSWQETIMSTFGWVFFFSRLQHLGCSSSISKWGKNGAVISHLSPWVISPSNPVHAQACLKRPISHKERLFPYAHSFFTNPGTADKSCGGRLFESNDGKSM
jgi:hypothetical protein